MLSKKRIVIGLFIGLLMGLLLCGCAKGEGPKLNGVPLSKYRIVGETEDYGTKLAVEELSEGIEKLTNGKKPKCKYGAKEGKKTIYIANSPSDVGTYSIEGNGDTIILSGPGILGRRNAVRELLSMLEGKEEVTVNAVEKAMFTLPKTVERIMEGKISIGVIGDSVTNGGGIAPWPFIMMQQLEKAYPYASFDVANEAISGRTTVWGAENIGGLLLESGYNDLVFISLGGNDPRSEEIKVTSQQTRESYVSMIKQVYESNPEAEIVFVMIGFDEDLCGIEGLEGGKVQDYMKHMIDVADEYNIPIIEPMSALYDACVEYAGGKDKAMDTGWKHYVQDYAHPYENGQELYGKVVWAHIKEALKAGTSLNGKKILFVGDSNVRASDDYGWPGRVKDQFGAITTKAAVNGAAISDARLLNRVIMQLEEHKDETYDYVILQGGGNDTWERVPVGTMSNSFNKEDFDISTFAGGLEELLCYAKEHFENAKIGYIVNFSRPKESVWDDMGPYFVEAKRICEKWEIPYLDLYFGSTEFQGEQKLYSQDILLTDTNTYFVDEIHLSAEGYDVISPYIGRWIATMDK